MPTPDGPERSDDALEQRLRDALLADPVPEAVLARARSAGLARSPAGSELLELTFDSVDRVRADGCTRLLVFAGAGLCLAVRLETSAGETSLSGWTAPTQVVRARLQTEDGTSDLAIDPNGTILINRVAIALSRMLLALDIQDERRVFHTSWFSL